jgi:cobalamin biosynthesis protein CbiG
MVGLDVVYSFAVRGVHGEAPSAVHGMEVNGTPVATLGHEVEGDEVLSHSFYGTKKVLDAISAMNAAAAAAGVPEPIIGDGQWAWEYDDQRVPVGISRIG